MVQHDAGLSRGEDGGHGHWHHWDYWEHKNKHVNACKCKDGASNDASVSECECYEGSDATLSQSPSQSDEAGSDAAHYKLCES